MKALIVIDMQYVITSRKDFILVQNNIDLLIKAYRQKGHKIIFTRYVSEHNIIMNPFHLEREESKIDCDLKEEEDMIILKFNKSIFKDTDLDFILKESDINDITIVGFHSDGACLFSAIAAYDRGYNVIFVEDAVDTWNSGLDYNVPGLKVNDVIAECLEHTSDIEVLLTEDLLGELSDYYI